MSLLCIPPGVSGGIQPVFVWRRGEGGSGGRRGEGAGGGDSGEGEEDSGAIMEGGLNGEGDSGWKNGSIKKRHYKRKRCFKKKIA